MCSKWERHPKSISGSRRPELVIPKRSEGSRSRLRRGLALAGITLIIGCQSADPVDPDITLGREIFTDRANPTCSTCHALSDAEAVATVGPNLDTLKPDSTKVSVAVRYGVGIMPPQVGVLTDEEISAVSKYVARIAGTIE